MNYNTQVPDWQRVSALVNDALASEPDDAAVKSYEALSEAGRAFLDSRAVAEGYSSTAAFLADADATRIARAREDTTALAIARQARRPR